MKKKPSLVIYWADTRGLLSFSERKALEQEGRIIAVTPLEVLIESPSGRKVVVRGISDAFAPKLPDIEH